MRLGCGACECAARDGVAAMATAIARGPIYQREKVVSDPKYLAWMRASTQCLVCGSTDVEAAHTHLGQAKAYGRKTSDWTAVPLCGMHHRTGKDAHHQLTPEPKWERHHGIDLRGEIARLHRRYEEETGRKVKR
jgi:hypothetical protein